MTQEDTHDYGESPVVVDVAVVGAGIAGLAAAKTIAAAGLTVAVLEARDRVGGRTWTTQVDGVELELGGQWISSDQDALLGLAEELGVKTYPRYRDGASIYLNSSGERRRFVGDFPVPEATQKEIQKILTLFTQKCEEIGTPTPWLHDQAQSLDAISWGEWLDAATTDVEAKSIVSIFIADGMFAKPAHSISMLEAIHMANSAGGFGNLVDEGVLLDHRVVGGLQEISKRIAESLGKSVNLECPVDRISWSPTEVLVRSRDVLVRARRVVIAVPTNLYSTIHFEPPLPTLKQQLHQHMSFGHIVKVQTFYDVPFWRSEGLSGTAFAPHLPIHETYDNTYFGSDLGCLVGFISDKKADDFVCLPEGERKVVALDCFSQYFGVRAAKPVAYSESSWGAEEWTRGSYGMSFDLGGLSRYGSLMTTPVGPLHWATSDLAGVGYMHVEGGYRVGQAAGEAIVDELKAPPT